MACSLLELDPPAANLSFVVGILSSFFYLISGGRGGEREAGHLFQGIKARRARCSNLV